MGHGWKVESEIVQELSVQREKDIVSQANESSQKKRKKPTHAAQDWATRQTFAVCASSQVVRENVTEA
jgi:hypothetical protein